MRRARVKLLLWLALPGALILTAMGPPVLSCGADLQTATFYVA